jgi:hypothetical protein
MSNQIDLKINATFISPENFLKGVEEFFALIQGVRKNLGINPVNWSVEVEKGSALIRAKPEHPTPQSQDTIDTVCSGINALRNGMRTMPPGFTKREVEAVRALSALSDGQRIQSIFIRNGKAPEELAPSIVDVVNAMLIRESHDAFGSVEGKIVNLSARQGFICVINDLIERREITCYLQKIELRRQIIRGFEDEVRVSAGGLIHYAKEGHPVSITVDTIRLFTPNADLPTVDEIQEIYRLYK